MTLSRPLESEYRHVSLGDARLNSRARSILQRWVAKPGASFPKMVDSNAELQGLYGLLENEAVDHRSLLDAHAQETIERIANSCLSTVLVLHDTTTFSFPGECERQNLGWTSSHTQGFNAHFALAVSADESRCPLGVVGLSTHMRSRPLPPKTPKKKRTSRLRGQDEERESLRWSQLALEVGERLKGRAVAIHVMDREGDAYITLASLRSHNQRFVIRAREFGRHVTSDEDAFVHRTTLGCAAERSVPVTAREVQLSRRKWTSSFTTRAKHPPRDARTARLEITASRVRVPKPTYLLEDVPETIDLNIVRAHEAKAPEGLDAVEWVLLTTEPIDTEEDVLRVIDHYRARWTIEEFFKAIKTGCAYEARQLESAHALLVALALCIPVAWQMLALRHQSRVKPSAPASTVISACRLRALRTLARTPLPAAPTVKEVFYAIAAIGGHIARNGPPGWITLRSGFDDLLLAERVIAAIMSTQ